MAVTIQPIGSTLSCYGANISIGSAYHWARRCSVKPQTNELNSSNSSATSNLNFAKWKSGNTNYPIVDACMRQLNETGYMSNRGRQLTPAV